MTESTTRPRTHLYIAEWLERSGMTPDQFADAVGVDRTSAYRWMRQQRRITTEKMGRIATALGIQPEDLFRAPGRPSIDAIVKDVPSAEVEAFAEFARKIAKHAS